jgi:hypothetical protein
VCEKSKELHAGIMSRDRASVMYWMWCSGRCLDFENIRVRPR